MLLTKHIKAVLQALFNTVFGLVEGGKKREPFSLYLVVRKEREE